MSKSKKELSFAEEVEQSLRKKFRKNIWCKFTKAINEYELVKPGDRIAVCISGGKDSMLLAKLFQELKRHNKFDFEVKFLVMDPGYSPVNRQVIEENAKRLEIPIEVFESDIFESVFNIEKSPCYLCARMRRGYLYSHAQKMGCNKIALGHHYDDVIETILMGMLYSAQVQTMMPKLHSTNFEGMELIRPLYMVREEDIKAWRDYNNVTALEHAREAVRLEPQNMQYQMLLQQLEGGGNWYQTRQTMYGYPGTYNSSWCVKLCIANLMCNICCNSGGLCLGGGPGGGTFM